MRVAPEVSRLKFAREVERLREQYLLLQQRGIFLLGQPTYPIVDLLYVPRAPLTIVRRVGEHAGLVLPAGMVATAEVPALATRAFKARFDLEDYDLRAPSVSFLDPWTDAPLEYSVMFRALEFESTRGAHPVLIAQHPATARPFLCLRGIREYHEHPQHTGDDWLLYRGAMSLFSAVNALWRAAIDLPRPLLDADQGRLQWVGPNKS